LENNKLTLLDLSQIISGPVCSMILADLGLNVIKIEPPIGDAARIMGDTFLNGQSDYILSLNRNKRSIVIDLKNPSGRELFYGLARKSDIILENFRPGTVKSLGIDYETVANIKPDIIYCSISGFGQSGPYKDRPAMDTIIQAMGGIMGITGDPRTGPQKVGSPIADFITSLIATIGILWALHIRTKTGLGQKVEISMLNSILFSIIPREAYFFMTGKNLPLTGNRHYQIAPSNTYRTRDGGFLMLIAHTQKHWENLCKCIKRTDLLDDTRFKTNSDRLKNCHELDGLLNETFSEKNQTEWVEFLSSKGVMVAPIYTFEQLFQDPQVLHYKMIHDLIHPVAGKIRVLKTPIEFSKTEVEFRTPPPLLGEHTREILLELGYGEEEIDLLLKKGAVSQGKRANAF